MAITHATLGNVQVLDLTSCLITDKGAAKLVTASLPKLVDLRLGTSQLGDKGTGLIAAWKVGLTHLSLVRGWVGEKGAEAIASASFGSSLTHLDLSQNEDLRDAGLRALLRSTSLTALRWLKLEYCGIRDAMVDELLESPLIQKLEHLDLSMNLSGEANKRIRERLGDRYKA